MASLSIADAFSDTDDYIYDEEERVALVENAESLDNEKQETEDDHNNFTANSSSRTLLAFKLCFGLLVLTLGIAILFTFNGDPSVGELDAPQPDNSSVVESVVVENPAEVKSKTAEKEEDVSELDALQPENSTVTESVIVDNPAEVKSKTTEKAEDVSADSVVASMATAVSEAVGAESAERPSEVESKVELQGDSIDLDIASEETKSESETQLESEIMSKEPEIKKEALEHLANSADEPDYTLFADETPKVVYDSLQYRRICANVGISSILCMTIRFPFEVPEQDPNYSYPRPFNKDYYKLDKGNGIQIVDGEKLENCKKATANMSMEDAIKQCLESNSSDELFQGAAVWTRRGKDGITRLYRTASPQQIIRNLGIFEKDEIVMIGGASRTPGVLNCLIPLFGKCSSNPVVHKGRGSYYCEHKRRRLEFGFEHMDESKFYIGATDSYFAPTDTKSHDIPDYSAAALLKLKRAAGWTKLKPFSIMVDYAWAHSQNHKIMTEDWEHVEYLMKGFPACKSKYRIMCRDETSHSNVPVLLP